MSSRIRGLWATVILPFFLSTAFADDAFRLKETMPAGRQFRIQSQFSGRGTLSVPSEKDTKGSKTLTKSASSRIDYVEKILGHADDGTPNRTIRAYQRVEFNKDIDGQKFDTTIREGVRRLVVVREGKKKSPFSPDGPLILSEIELVSNDVFTPSLETLMPPNPVKPGDQWKAGTFAVRELTDMEVESGEITCRLVEATMLAGRRVAHVSLSGAVRGVGADGPTRHEFEGHYYFDLQSSHLAYLTLKGKQIFLDADGKTTGSLEGTLTVTRTATEGSPKLSDDSLRNLRLTPDEGNTLLWYENDDLGVRFAHPRRWRVAGTVGRQIMLDSDNGSGLRLTLLTARDVPTPEAFAKEVVEFIRESKGAILSTRPGRTLQTSPEVVCFGHEADMPNRDGKPERKVLDYFVIRGTLGGATLAATLTPEESRQLRPEIERIARSIEVTK